MFDEQWFLKHQKKMLWFANTSFGKDILCINGNKSSLSGEKIVSILPNSVTIRTKGNEYATEFSSSNKFSDLIYTRGYYLWKALHTWDTLFANQFAPAFNLGFDDFYSASGAAFPVDGFVEELTPSATLFSSLLSGFGIEFGSPNWATGPVPKTYPVGYVAKNAGTSGNIFFQIWRSIQCFDTSTLGSGAVINTATISYNLYLKTDPGTGTTGNEIHVVSSTPTTTSNIVNADWFQFGSTSFGSKVYVDWATGYNDIDLNAAGISNINTTGTSKFGTKIGWDFNGSYSGPTQAGTYSVDVYATEQGTLGGNDVRPRLTINWSPAGGGFLSIL